MIKTILYTTKMFKNGIKIMLKFKCVMKMCVILMR